MKAIKIHRKFSKRYLKYLFWLGPVLVVMGLTAGAVVGNWAGIPGGLIGIGLVATIAWLLYEGYTSGFWGRRSTQVGTNALVSTLAVLAILGMVIVLAVRYNYQVDLTENQVFTLAPQSQEVLRSLDQPVKAWVFTPSASPVDQQLLKNYQNQSSQFSYEYVDPQVKPGVAREFGVQSIGEVYLEAGKTRRFVQAITPTERLSERRLTNGLVQIKSNFQPKVYFLQGHGERALEATQGGLSQATGGLKGENYVAEPLNLATNPQIPEDASVIVLAGPQRPLLDAEVKALKAFQEKKSGLLLLVDPQTDPKLDSLLQDWGASLSDRLITDPAGESSGLGPGVVIVNQYGDHPITRPFGDGISFYPLARPVQLSVKQDVQATPILITSDRTKAQRIDPSGELQFDEATDPKGPFNLGVALSRTIKETPSAEPSPNPSPSPSPSPEATNQPEADSPEAADSQTDSKPEARLVLIGSSSFATDGLFEQQLNGDVFMNSITWLSQQDDQVLTIRPKEFTNRRIVLSVSQQVTTLLVAIVLLPLVGFGTAAAVWWRRR